MPFYKDFTDDNASILFWKFDDEDSFNEVELIEPQDFEKVKNYHPKKLKEYLMIRRLLKMQLPEHKILYRTEGQPYLFPKDYFISITHSFPFASIAISKKRVGIDLEKPMPKILNIKHKFLNPSEILWVSNEREIEMLTVIWVIKEALYKLHPSKFWSLDLHYEVKPFHLDDLSEVECRVFDDDFEDRYIARISIIENFYFAVIEENHSLNFKLHK